MRSSPKIEKTSPRESRYTSIGEWETTLASKIALVVTIIAIVFNQGSVFDQPSFVQVLLFDEQRMQVRHLL